MLAELLSLKVAVVAASTTGVLLTGGVAAAATGSLPGAAQDTAQTVLATIGVSVPGADDAVADDAVGDDPDGQGAEAEVPAAEEMEDVPPTDAEGKGAEISRLARDPELSGVEKGAAVSTAASDGRSRAGQHGKAVERGRAAREDGEGSSAGKKSSAGKGSSSEAGEMPDSDTQTPVEAPGEDGAGTATTAGPGDAAKTTGKAGHRAAAGRGDTAQH